MSGSRDFSSVRGFNYQPGYAATGVEIWRGFRADWIAREIERAKQIFPHINAMRVWLSFDAWLIEPATAAHLAEVLDVLERNGLRAVVTVFNGWHSFPDFGGITPEHMSLFASDPGRFGPLYRGFIEDVVGPLASDERVLAWDLCNEPFNCGEFENTSRWLEFACTGAQRLKPTAPLGVSVSCEPSEMERVEPFCDLLMIHPYVTSVSGAAAFRDVLDRAVAFAGRCGKELLATECCWGALDDAERGALVRISLEELTRRGIGWLAHLLNHTPVADGHRPEFGAVSHAGYMAFIEADGSPRAHHGIVNDFC